MVGLRRDCSRMPSIFWVVGISLIASWLVAVTFTPFLGVRLLPDGQAHGKPGHGQAYNSRFHQWLRRAVTFCVDHPQSVVAPTAVAFGIALFGFTTVQQQFFPQSARPELIINVRLAEGSSFEATAAEVARIEELSLFTTSGKAVPLSQVAVPVYDHEEPILWRRNRETMLTVQADVRDGWQAPDVSKRISAKLVDVKASLPAGYRLKEGGAIEESGKANSALFAVFPPMVLVMWTLLMAQVQNFRKAVLVFVISPLGIIGAITALHFSTHPLGSSPCSA